MRRSSQRWVPNQSPKSPTEASFIMSRQLHDEITAPPHQKSSSNSDIESKTPEKLETEHVEEAPCGRIGLIVC